jgi:nitrogen fixation protein NifU and related proteins
MAYSEKVVDHFSNPRNMGSFKKDEGGIGTGIVGAPECGDVMKLQIKVQDDTIVDAKFKTFGCGSAIASSSLSTEWLKGKTIEEAGRLQNTDIVQELNLPLSRSIARSWQRMRSRRPWPTTRSTLC